MDLSMKVIPRLLYYIGGDWNDMSSISPFPLIGMWRVMFLSKDLRYLIPFLNITHRIHAWYIYLHLVDFYGKCR